MSMIKSLVLCWAFPLVALATKASAVEIVPPGSLKLQDLLIAVPDGWKIAQEATSSEIAFAGFSKGQDYLTVYVKRGGGVQMESIFVNGSRVTREKRRQRYGRYDFEILETAKERSGAGSTYVAAFMTMHRGNTYYGYSGASTQVSAMANVQAFLGAMN